MYLYIASAEVYRPLFIAKLGCTIVPYERKKTYQTGCPPGLSPSHDIEYDGIWETTALSQDELFEQEDELHNYFLKYRMMREKPGDSEWFNFQGKIPYDEVKKFMETRPWVKRQVPLSEILPQKKTSRYLRKQHKKNLNYIKTPTVRISILNNIQEPVISAVRLFMTDPNQKAGYVIAPCGSGKTIMSCKGIIGIKTCIVLCPSKQIQNQWQSTLIAEQVFNESDIYIVGGAGTTNPDTIREIMSKDTFAIISTYMSSHLLVDSIHPTIELLIPDEAHHMAGKVPTEENGEGRTRRLMLKASELGIKRLSLTYTPRFIVRDVNTHDKYLTMDDDSIFGKKIAELKIRDLIRKGVLPDYRLWTLRDESKKGSGIIGKAECILEAWEATEFVRTKENSKQEQYMLHHLIIFASTTEQAKDLEEFFKAKTIDTVVLRVEEGDKLETPIEQFTVAPRAILINCFVLNEGVDIPIANAVAITYPKQSRGQITQMILRAGRWYEGKSIFHVLIPTLGDEDLSGFEEVLSALASCDEQIRDEIILLSRSKCDTSDSSNNNSSDFDAEPESIMIDEFEAELEEIKQCFTNIRKNLFPARESRRIQEICMEKGIDTSIDYFQFRKEIPELPEDPRPKGVLWYNYLHPISNIKLTPSDFVQTILNPNNLHVSHVYDKWLEEQLPENKDMLPTVQYITDGLFGADYTNFNTLIQRFSKKIVGRGR